MKAEGPWSAIEARALAQAKNRPVVTCVDPDCWVIYPPNDAILIQGGYSTAERAQAVASRLWSRKPITVERPVSNPPPVPKDKSRAHPQQKQAQDAFS